MVKVIGSLLEFLVNFGIWSFGVVKIWICEICILENWGDFLECLVCGSDGFSWVFVFRLGKGGDSVGNDKCKKKVFKF